MQETKTNKVEKQNSQFPAITTMKPRKKFPQIKLKQKRGRKSQRSDDLIYEPEKQRNQNNGTKAYTKLNHKCVTCVL